MAWSTTAPRLPGRASWGGTKTTEQFSSAVWYSLPGTSLSIARLSRTEIAVRAAIRVGEGSQGYNAAAAGTFYLRSRSSGRQDSISTTIAFPGSTGTKTVYWTGADTGNSVSITVGRNDTASSERTVTLSVPNQLTPDIRVMAEDGFMNIDDVQIGGAVPETAKVMNANNEWVEV